MAGIFVRSKYKTDDGRVFRARIQPETALLSFGSQQNAPTVDPVTEPELISLRKNIKSSGINSRRIGVKWVSDIPAGYKPSSLLYIPILTPAIFNAIQLDQQAQYLNGTVVVVSKIQER